MGTVVLSLYIAHDLLLQLSIIIISLKALDIPRAEDDDDTRNNTTAEAVGIK